MPTITWNEKGERIVTYTDEEKKDSDAFRAAAMELARLVSRFSVISSARIDGATLSQQNIQPALKAAREVLRLGSEKP